MDDATESPSPSGMTLLLAGLQAGMLGACWMLAWLGVSAAWQRRSFWTAENLMASLFYGDGAIRSGFAGRTLSGLAVYLLIYSLLGALFARVAPARLPRFRVLLVSLVFALGWYYLFFQVIGRTLLPLMTLLHATQPTVLGHLVYGTFLGRYPVYLEAPKAPVAHPEQEEVHTDAAPSE